jgi:hypothetical protein
MRGEIDDAIIGKRRALYGGLARRLPQTDCFRARGDSLPGLHPRLFFRLPALLLKMGSPKPMSGSASCSLRASTHSASRLAMEGSTLTAWRRSSQTISGEHIKNSIKLFLTTPIA